MKYIILFLLYASIHAYLLGQPLNTTNTIAMASKEPPPVSTSGTAGHQDNPNRIQAFCFQPNILDTVWIEIDQGVCGGNVSSNFPSIVDPFTSDIGISTAGSIYYVAPDINLIDHYYYPFIVNTWQSGVTGNPYLGNIPDIFVYYFITQGGVYANDSTYCRDTLSLFFYISADSCSNNDTLLDVENTINCPPIGAGVDVTFDSTTDSVTMHPDTTSGIGTWTGGRGIWQGNIYKPDICENCSTIHAIWTVISDSCICSGMDTALIFIPCGSVSSVPDPEKTNRLNIYPNPTTGWLNIEITHNETEGKLILYNLLGQIVLEKQVIFVGGKAEIDLSPLPQGMYSLVLRAGNLYEIRKVIKE